MKKGRHPSLVARLQLALHLDSEATAGEIVAVVTMLYQDQVEPVVHIARCLARANGRGLGDGALERVEADAAANFNRLLRQRAGIAR